MEGVSNDLDRPCFDNARCGRRLYRHRICVGRSDLVGYRTVPLSVYKRIYV